MKLEPLSARSHRVTALQGVLLGILLTILAYFGGMYLGQYL